MTSEQLAELKALCEKGANPQSVAITEKLIEEIEWRNQRLVKCGEIIDNLRAQLVEAREILKDFSEGSDDGWIRDEANNYLSKYPT